MAGWQAGWLAHYSRPALLAPGRPTTSAAAAPMPPLAAPPSRCTTAAFLRQPAAPATVWCNTTSTKLPHSHAVITFHLGVREGAWRPLTAPLAGAGGLSANMRICQSGHPASNGGATLLPSASSWQCISNAKLREVWCTQRRGTALETEGRPGLR